jgi:hypothetical protein
MNLLNVDHGVHCRSLPRRYHHGRPDLPRSLILRLPPSRQDQQPEKHTLIGYFRTNNELYWDTKEKVLGKLSVGTAYRSSNMAGVDFVLVTFERFKMIKMF